MANKFDNNEALAFQEEEANLSRVENLLDGLISKEQEKVELLIEKIEQLKQQIGIKKTIKDYGIDEQDFLNRLDEMTEQAFDDQCTGANPRYPLLSEIKEMYLRAYYGGNK